MPNTGSGSATRQLAEFAASIKFSDLPADDQVRTKLRLLNVAGSVLAARRLAGAALVRSYSETLDRRRPAVPSGSPASAEGPRTPPS